MIVKKCFVILTSLIIAMAGISPVTNARGMSEESSLKMMNMHRGKARELFQKAGVIPLPAGVEPVEIILRDLDNREVRISDFQGKILFMNFWATWCVPCRKEMPSMERLYQRFKDKDFAIIAINLQEPVSHVKEFFQDYKLTFIGLLDSTGEVGKRFRVYHIPTTFILDKTGRIIGKAIGERSWDSKESIALFEYLTAI